MAYFQQPLKRDKIPANVRDQIKDSITQEISQASNHKSDDMRAFLSDVIKLASMYLDYRANIPKSDVLPYFVKPASAEIKLKQECDKLTSNYSPHVAEYMVNYAVTTVDNAINEKIGKNR